MNNYQGFFIKSDYPEQQQVVEFVNVVKDHLFPVIENENDFIKQQSDSLTKINNLLFELLSIKSVRTELEQQKIIFNFSESLISIKQMLLKDAALFLEFDPASDSLEEVILSYPGFFSIMMHRIANILYKMKVPLLPRMIAEWAHGKTGIDINPGAEIGCPFFIDHGTGVVIGETCIIGNSVKLYQGVTLGALVVNKNEAHHKRHPTIEDNVVIYAGSTILGGKTVIGHDSIIGGNTWITESIAPNSVVYHKNQTIIADRNHKLEPINFVI